MIDMTNNDEKSIIDDLKDIGLSTKRFIDDKHQMLNDEVDSTFNHAFNFDDAARVTAITVGTTLAVTAALAAAPVLLPELAVGVAVAADAGGAVTLATRFLNPEVIQVASKAIKSISDTATIIKESRAVKAGIEVSEYMPKNQVAKGAEKAVELLTKDKQLTHFHHLGNKISLPAVSAETSAQDFFNDRGARLIAREEQQNEESNQLAKVSSFTKISSSSAIDILLPELNRKNLSHDSPFPQTINDKNIALFRGNSTSHVPDDLAMKS